MNEMDTSLEIEEGIQNKLSFFFNLLQFDETKLQKIERKKKKKIPSIIQNSIGFN